MSVPMVYLVPDAASLIDLQTRQQLPQLIHPAWSILVPDAVMHVLVHADDVISRDVLHWIAMQNIAIVDTQAFLHHIRMGNSSSSSSRASLVNCAIQELLTLLASQKATIRCVLLTHENRCKNPQWWIPGNCLRIVPRALSKFREMRPESAVSGAGELKNDEPSPLTPEPSHENPRVGKNSTSVGEKSMSTVRIPPLFNAHQIENALRDLAGNLGQRSGKVLVRIRDRWSAHRLSVSSRAKPGQDLVDIFRRNLH